MPCVAADVARVPYGAACAGTFKRLRAYDLDQGSVTPMHQEERPATLGPPRRVARFALIGPWLGTDSTTVRYGGAAIAVVVITLLRAALNPLLGTTTPLLPLIPAVLL